MQMPFYDNTFDAIYAIEATCHAPDAVYKLVKFFSVIANAHNLNPIFLVGIGWLL